MSEPYYSSVAQRDDGLWYFIGRDGQVHGPFPTEDEAIGVERDQWRPELSFPPEPTKDEVLKMAKAWLDEHARAAGIGRAHLLIHRLYIQLKG